jgi:signal transduction histidine kinase
VSIIVAMVVLGVAVQVLLGRHLRESLDSSLRDRAAAIAQLSASTPSLVKSPAVLEQSLGPHPLQVEVVNSHGTVVARSLSLGGTALPVGSQIEAAIASGRSAFGTVDVGDDQQLRVYIAPLPSLGGPASGGAVAVASTTDDVTSTLRESRALIVLSALAAAVLVIPIAYFLTGGALLPLRRLAAGAEVIEVRGDPRLRLPVDPGQGRTPDEVQRLAETLNRMLSALEHARDSERRFIADASHELRNPLTALRGNAAYLERNGADPAALHDLREDAERLSRLVDQLLAVAREDAAGLPTEPVRLDELAHAYDGDADVTVQANGATWVRGDRDALERALANLVDNARRHGPPGGRVEVESGGGDGEAWLAVSDTGVGIADDSAELATERFWRGPGAEGGGGSGLGLALVRATAERHGGRLQIAGSRFTIQVPALKPLSESPGTTERDPSGAGGSDE